MATYNTAFGSLPSPKQLTGRENTTGAQGPRRYGSQMQPGQPGRQPQPGMAQQKTFSELQKEGKARPAPQQQPSDGPQFAQTDAAQTFRQQLQGQMGTPTPTQYRSYDATPSAPAQPTMVGAGAGAATAGAPAAPAVAGTPVGAGVSPAAAATVASAGAGTTPGAADVAQFGGSAQAMGLREALQQQLMALQGAPSRYEDPGFKAARQAAIANMEAQFGAQRSQLEEELASRGLAASSIAAGRFGDIAGQQARARATMEADLLKEQAMTSAQDRAQLLEGLGSLAQTAGQQDIATYEANLRARQLSSDIDFRAKQLQQEERLKGRELDLQQARDMATTEYQRGQLGLGYAELGSKERIEKGKTDLGYAELAQRGTQFEKDLQERQTQRLQNLGISNRELDLKAQEIQANEKLRGRDLDLQQARDQALKDYQAQQLMREDRSLSLQEARDKASQEIDRERTELQRQSIASQEKQAQLDRDLRRQLGLGDQQISGAQLMVSIIDRLGAGALTPDMIAMLRDKYGLNIGGGAAGGAIGGTTRPPVGGGYTTSGGGYGGGYPPPDGAGVYVE